LNIIDYFKEDPMRLLALIGGTGGVVYWIDRYQNRTRIKIRLIKYGFFTKRGEVKSDLVFEVENLGTTPTSLESYIVLKGFIPKSMQHKPEKLINREKYIFKIEETNRNLIPNMPKVMTARGEIDSTTPFLWFMTYVFKPTRGKTCKVRIRSANKTRMNLFQYLIELSTYILFRYLKCED